MDTRTDLVALLCECSPSATRDRLIAACQRGDFHDYCTTSATPKRDLVESLDALGYANLARRVIAGDFDEDCNEEDRRALLELLDRG